MYFKVQYLVLTEEVEPVAHLEGYMSVSWHPYKIGGKSWCGWYLYNDGN